MQVAPKAPAQELRGEYHLRHVDGVDIYTHSQLVQTGPQVKLDLGGFWRLRWLKVSGLAGAAACGI